MTNEEVITNFNMISRERALEPYKDLNDDDVISVKLIKKNITELPLVTPKSETVTEFADRCRECGKMRKGHWKQISPAKIYECSECGKNVMTDDICAYGFCHGCGAKMVEPQESEG